MICIFMTDIAKARPKIHPTALIEEGAELAENVEVGAFAYIGPRVKLGPGTIIRHHATVEGVTELGSGNEVFPYALIGGKTHDLKFKGGQPGLLIGNNNTFREYVTVHPATNDGDYTRIGNHNTILAYSHIAHDCQVGDYLVMSSHAALGGHVVVEDRVNIGWGAGIHQFCRIGKYAMVAAASKMVQDLPPFLIADGNPAHVRAYNRVGMERVNFAEEDIKLVHQIYKILFRDGLNRTQAIQKLKDHPQADHDIFASFFHFFEHSTRGVR